MKTVLLALSAKNTHKTLAPWCLKAYSDTFLRGAECVVLEYSINDSLTDILDGIYAEKPEVLGLSCYIWNVETTAKVVCNVRQILPTCKIILGGPEVTENGVNGIEADFFVQGPGERRFAEILNGLYNCAEYTDNTEYSTYSDYTQYSTPYTQRFFDSFASGKMVSIANQLIYYESARGCPFSCSYCVSSLTSGVEELPPERVLCDIDMLASKGASCVKFVDRTFNANPRRAAEILRHIKGMDTKCVFHFEVCADLFTDELLQLVGQMPRGRVQFEIGVQSTNPETLVAANRKTNLDAAFRNIERLIEYGNTHVHVDLIAGLPFETLDSFKRGVNRCLQVRPHMLQLGVLKMLKNTQIRREAGKYGYISNPFPPYQVFSNDFLSYEDMTEIRRVTVIADKFYNSGLFANSLDCAIGLLGGYNSLKALADFCRGKNIKSTQKYAYTLMLEFLKMHVNTRVAEHNVKMDCLTFDPKNQLPDGITPRRGKAAEAEYRSRHKSANVRAEYFEYSEQTLLFDYSERDMIAKRYKVAQLPSKPLK